MPSSSASRNWKPPASSRRSAAELQQKLKADIAAIGQDRSKLNQQLIDIASPGAQRRDPHRRRRGAAAPARQPRAADPRLARFAPLRDRRGAGGAAARRTAHAAGAAGAARRRAAIAAHRHAARRRSCPNCAAARKSWPPTSANWSRLRKTIATERDALALDRDKLKDDQVRLAALVDERQRKQSAIEKDMEAEGARAIALSRQVDSLQGLIAKMEQDLKSAAKAAATASLQGAPAALNGKPNLGALKDPARLSPAIAFASAKGLFAYPVNGAKIRDFGGSDGAGGVEKGISLATRAGAQVTTPCDGWVVYAGPFRSYGQLLILNAGGGYHVLIAGMERISVNIGQFVLTGSRSRPWDRHPRLHPFSRPTRASPCSMSSSVRTALQSIQAHGGPQMKAKRFADDAQDFCNSPQRRHRRGIDAVRDAASRRADGIERACRDLGHLSPAQSVRRRVRAGAQRLCREARRQQAGRDPRSAACWPASIRIRATWTPRASATCRCRPAANSAGSASRSRWKTA